MVHVVKRRAIRSIRAEKITRIDGDWWLVLFTGEMLNRRYNSPFGRTEPRETIERWIEANCSGDTLVSHYGVQCKDEDDAMLCYLAWR
jgi:hypothetical protein